MMDLARNLQRMRETGRGDGPYTHDLNNTTGLIEMIEYAKPKHVLELGSDLGVSTECFLLLCDTVTVVDPWADYPEHYDRFMQRCAKYPGLKVIRGYSPAALADLPDASFDLVYIDAVHIYQPCIDDARAAHRLVRPGGWIAGHDYSPYNIDDIIPAVHAMFGEENIKTYSEGSWLARRPDVIPDTPPATGRLLRSPSMPSPVPVPPPPPLKSVFAPKYRPGSINNRVRQQSPRGKGVRA